MDKNSVIERLNQLVQAGGKLKPIELTLNMPQNCLSNYASGKKELPGKWVKPLSDHLENLNKKRVVLIECEDGKFIFMNPDGTTRKCKLVWVDEESKIDGIKVEKCDPISMKIKTAGKIEPFKSADIPPMPKREDFENSIDFAAAKNEWKIKYGQ